MRSVLVSLYLGKKGILFVDAWLSEPFQQFAYSCCPGQVGAPLGGHIALADHNIDRIERNGWLNYLWSHVPTPTSEVPTVAALYNIFPHNLCRVWRQPPSALFVTAVAALLVFRWWCLKAGVHHFLPTLPWLLDLIIRVLAFWLIWTSQFHVCLH